jgi:glutamyl-Q tRNA(Asp) synthetase
VRIEDIDTPRVVAGADAVILGQLAALGMHHDAAPVWQSHRLALYQNAFDRLAAAGQVYPCACTRRALPAGPYPGTCRNGLAAGRKARAWRFRVPDGIERFTDRWCGPQCQDVALSVGDVIIRRADGLWAYQLVVVVDDGDQGITHIVRGADLLDSTARQRQLARALGLPCPATLHVPLVLDTSGRKLSKQNHAAALDLANPLRTLNAAWQALGFSPIPTATLHTFWQQATLQWANRFGLAKNSPAHRPSAPV